MSIAQRYGRIAGVSGSEFMERREPVESAGSDPDACLKLLKSMHAVTMIKSEDETEEVAKVVGESERITGPQSVTQLIKLAHRAPAPIATLEAGATGREQARTEALAMPVTKANIRPGSAPSLR